MNESINQGSLDRRVIVEPGDEVLAAPVVGAGGRDASVRPDYLRLIFIHLTRVFT